MTKRILCLVIGILMVFSTVMVSTSAATEDNSYASVGCDPIWFEVQDLLDYAYECVDADENRHYFFKGEPEVTQGIEFYQNVDTAQFQEETTTETAEQTVININGENHLVNVGDTVVYTVELYAEELFENIQGSVYFDMDKLEIVDISEIYPPMPNLEEKKSVLNTEEIKTAIKFNASDIYGIDFTQEKVLLNLGFRVKSEGFAEIDLKIDFMTIKGSDRHYFFNGKPEESEGINITESLGFVNIQKIIGDTDRNGKVNIKDATILQKFIADIVHFDDVTKSLADANGDDKINIKDATIIQKFVAGFYIDTGVGEVVEDDEVETYRYYFYMPDSWLNDSTETTGNTAGIYWWDGTDAHDCWPGIAAKKADAEGIYYCDVPVDVTTIVWNNFFDGGMDRDAPYYAHTIQTYNIATEYYDPDESVFYPEGTLNFDGMIYVTDPSKYDEISTKPRYSGEWFYYYGNGEYGITPTRGDSKILTGETVDLFPLETELVAEHLTVYFVKPDDWEDAFVYGYADDSLQWPCEYPGVPMDYYCTTYDGKEIYSFSVPETLDYIKFSDGQYTNSNTANKRTVGIALSKQKLDRVYYITDYMGNNKWNIDGCLLEELTNEYTRHVKIQFVKPKDWEDAYCCVLKEEGGYYSDDFPGVSMNWIGFYDDNIDNELYYAEVPENAPAILISDGSEYHKRIDIIENEDIVNGRTFFADEEIKENKWTYKYEDTLESIDYTIHAEYRIADYAESDSTRIFLARSPKETEDIMNLIVKDPYYSTPTLEDYTEEYFEDKALVISFNCVGGSNCAQSVGGLRVQDNCLVLYRYVYKPEMVTCDMNYRCVIIEVDKKDIEGVECVEDKTFTIEHNQPMFRLLSDIEGVDENSTFKDNYDGTYTLTLDIEEGYYYIAIEDLVADSYFSYPGWIGKGYRVMFGGPETIQGVRGEATLCVEESGTYTFTLFEEDMNYARDEISLSFEKVK